jgi:DNA-directed RNA polymerase specialized sigma24 family protein
MTSAYTTLRRKPIKAIQNRMAHAYDRVALDKASEVDVCDELTDVALAQDTDWVRGVIAREILRQLRLPQDKRDTKDKRMTRAVRLREQGLTIRQIAEQLGASIGTVQSDLKRWGSVRPKVVAFKNGVQDAHEAAASTQEPPTELNAESEQPSNVTSIRRTS